MLRSSVVFALLASACAFMPLATRRPTVSTLTSVPRLAASVHMVDDPAAKAAAGGAGGGATMAANREAIKNKSMVACEICKANMPDVKSMQVCQIDLNVQDIVSNDS